MSGEFLTVTVGMKWRQAWQRVGEKQVSGGEKIVRTSHLHLRRQVRMGRDASYFLFFPQATLFNFAYAGSTVLQYWSLFAHSHHDVTLDPPHPSPP